jgi:hypothetical protein
MKDEIIKELRRLEQELEIKVLYAVESGSRAWGFASRDSDWDVRFLYIHKLDWYLRIDQERDYYVKILDNEIDLSGWELKKALKLFRKSNPHLLEWMRSPIVYNQHSSAIDKMRDLKKLYFDPKSCFHHYLNVAVHNFEGYLADERINLKKLFYVLRTILAADWIYEHRTTVPVEFPVLLESQITDALISNEIISLLKRKGAGTEQDIVPKNDLLQEFLEEKIACNKARLSSLTKRVTPETAPLNVLFKETLSEVW